MRSSNNPLQCFCAATIKPLQSYFGELFNQQEPGIKENLEQCGPKKQREQRKKKKSISFLQDWKQKVS